MAEMTTNEPIICGNRILVGDQWVSIHDLLDHKSQDATASEIVLQLLWCNYECEAGPLHNNTMFRSLVHKAWEEGCPTWGRQPDGSIGPCYDCAHCKLFGGL